jgi:hypothetical protein
MAKRSFAGSKALGYQESYFANRNDMLQSALDAVLLKYDDEMARYEAAVELYRDATKIVEKERTRLLKLKDDLAIKQISGAQATEQFNAGQLNSAARTQAGIDASDARFDAKQAALAAYYGTRLFTSGGKGADDVVISEARQAYSGSPTDINIGLNALGQQFTTTTEVPKTPVDRDVGRAVLFQQYLADEVRKDEYQALPPDIQLGAAAEALIANVTEDADRASIVRGLEEQTKRSAGAGATAAAGTERKGTGGISVQTVAPPNYLDLIADVDKRLSSLAAQGVTPEKPEAPDLIKLQRDEYFRTFFPGYTPAYQLTEAGQRALSLGDEAAAEELRRFRASRPGTMLSTPPTPEARTFTPPRMPGDVIYGEGSPFSPVTSAGVPEINERIEAYRRGEAGVELEPYFRGIPTVVPPEPFTLPDVRSLEKQPIEVTVSAQQAALDGLLGQIASGEKALEEAKRIGDTAKVAEIEAALDNYNEALDRSLLEFNKLRESERIRAEQAAEDAGPQYLLDAVTRPGGLRDRREVNKIMKEREKEAKEAPSAPEAPPQTSPAASLSPTEKDKTFKIASAKRASGITNTPEFNRMLQSEVGSAVRDLYNANKSKGDQTGKQLLAYIAEEFPKVKDQEIAADVYYGLAYDDETAGLLGKQKAV